MTTIKITKAVQSFTLKAASGDILNFCKNINAPITVVKPDVNANINANANAIANARCYVMLLPCC